MLRQACLARLGEGVHDVLVVGAGINGAVSAAALAGRGARVALVDRGDFASFTSQESSNLVWGGIKYLETYELPLVRDLCVSRNLLMRSYPSTVREIRFLATVERGFRHHPLLLWASTWAYWLIGNGATEAPRRLGRAELEAEEPMVDTSRFGGCVEYSDAYLFDNDARFVFGFVRSAMDRGAVAVNYAESCGARLEDGVWVSEVRDLESGRTITVRSRALINAAGAFADAHNQASGLQTAHRHVFSKGIHLIVDRITDSRRVLAFFADDGRLFFAIPMGSKTCLGTTDTRVDDPRTGVTDADRDFVLDNVNRRLRLARPLTRADIVAERCGVRPLVVERGASEAKDFLQLSRKHAVDVDAHRCHLTIYGGKLTDCINVGDEVCEAISGMGIALPSPRARWFGEPPPEVREEFLAQARALDLDALTSPHATEPLSQRFWRRYGHQAVALLDAIRADRRQAELLIEGTEYTRCEIAHAASREMVVRLEDFLRRRSKIALMMRRDEIRAARGLDEACRMLFGDEADARLAEYFGRND
ncbi:MAG: glycerol-3-phosphate dehydrogenase/oxidase [Ectothiorhodospiraceae bacterium]|nr:glycerol-3-phosphate dehydrogenase/oxidase [Ectothiorhodospiraceae bacterium]